MGHCIQGILGRRGDLLPLETDWARARVLALPQDYGMVLLTLPLLEDLEARGLAAAVPAPSPLAWFSPQAAWLMESVSLRTRLAYIETDYFGGTGTQAGVLYEDGRVSLGPEKGGGTIETLLEALGVRPSPGQDRFAALELGRYRRMPDG